MEGQRRVCSGEEMSNTVKTNIKIKTDDQAKSRSLKREGFRHPWKSEI